MRRADDQETDIKKVRNIERRKKKKMIFRVYGLEANSYVDGPGVRLAIFFQGCLHHCKGCQNPGSWPMYGGEKMDTEFIKKLMVSDSLLSGITLSGGEPFLQPMAALELAQFAKAKGLSVWCYTGYTFEQIREWEDNRKELLKRIDVLVDGRFEQDMASMELDWRGSANQRLINVPESLEKGCVVLYEKQEAE